MSFERHGDQLAMGGPTVSSIRSRVSGIYRRFRVKDACQYILSLRYIYPAQHSAPAKKDKPVREIEKGFGNDSVINVNPMARRTQE